MKFKLTKYMSRERGLFYLYVWNTANMTEPDKFSMKIQNIAFVYNGTKTNAYYDLNELKRYNQVIFSKYKTIYQYVDKVVKRYMKYWNLLLPYIKGKKIEDTTALIKFYNTWIKWWSTMSVIFVSPDNTDLPKEVRNKLLEVRKKHEKYSEKGEQAFLEFFKRKYPQYKNISKVVTPTEVFSLEKELFNSKQLKIIQERKKGFALINAKLYLIRDLENGLKENNIKLIEPKINQEKIIKGNTATLGVVKGTVKIVILKNDLEKIKEGDVLVAEMTHPEYVVAMKKAIAIITDEGGIVSHAAIVSRELGKPCIVGTKNATKVLKDGDYIEVDADKGVVRLV